MTEGDEVTWSRGCKDTCESKESGTDFLRCCSQTNLCNLKDTTSETSGSDVINRMSAIVLVVMAMAARYLAWIVNKKYSMWQIQKKNSPHSTSTSFYLLKLLIKSNFHAEFITQTVIILKYFRSATLCGLW